MPKHKKQNKQKERSAVQVVLWLLAFMIIGVTALLLTHAATGSYSFEAESGTTSGTATKETVTNTSGGLAVKFNSSCISGQCMPKGSVTSGGHTWTQIVADDFTKDAALGSFGSDCTKQVVYTGADGTGWISYPKCFLDTYQKRPYRADAVLSVHDGTLDFWLHNVDGIPAGANLAPQPASTGNQYQTYGRYEARFKITSPNLSDYYQAWLLWPNDNTVGRCSESDFPEAILSSTTISAFSHYCTVPDDGTNHQSAFTGLAVDRTQWHTYTQEWMPGKRNYYIDGVLKGSTTTNIWSGPMRWQLQTETKSLCDQGTTNTCAQDASGNLLVDWAVVYAY